MEAVRPAVAADAERFLELVQNCFDGMVPQRGGSLLLAQMGHLEGVGTIQGFEGLLSDPERLVLLGWHGDTAMAMALCRIEVLEDGSAFGHIDGCYVEPEARGLGLGQLLVGSAMTWFEQYPCVGVNGWALPGDRDAKTLFETAGFKARLLTMYRPIG